MLAKMIKGNLWEYPISDGDCYECTGCDAQCKQPIWRPVFPNQDVEFNNIFPLQNGIMKGV
jgi:hypothetical protein